MCRCPRRAWCGVTDCTIIPTRRRWWAVGPTWDNRPWSCRRLWCGRRRVPSVATPIRNGVRPVASCWCVPRSSHVGVPRRQCSRRSGPHAGHTAGAPLPGGSYAARQLSGGRRSPWDACGTPEGRGPCSPVPQPGLLLGAPGWMPAGYPSITSIACAEGTSLDRLGTRQVQQGVEADTWPSGVGGEGVAR